MGHVRRTALWTKCYFHHEWIYLYTGRCGGVIVPSTSGTIDDSAIASMSSLSSLILHFQEELQVSWDAGQKRTVGEVEIIDKTRVRGHLKRIISVCRVYHLCYSSLSSQSGKISNSAEPFVVLPNGDIDTNVASYLGELVECGVQEDLEAKEMVRIP